MSESAGKTFRGLQEAYASIYADKSQNLTEDTIVSEVQEEQEFEINEEALYESAIGYLIHFGYASDEKKAAAMIPHMSEQWITEFLIHDILAENFVITVNSLLEEGKDLGGYTWDELYEGYCSNAAENLNEAIPLAIPAIGAGIGVLGGLANLAKGMQKRKPAPTGPSTWDYGQSGTSTYKPKPAATTVKTDSSTAGDSPILGPTGKPIRRVPVTTSASEQPAASTGGPTPEPPKKDDKPEPPKDKGPNWFQRKLEQISKGVQADRQKAAAEKAAREAAKQAAQASGKPSKTERLSQVASTALRRALPYGLGTLGADLASGGATRGIGQGATSQFAGDVAKLVWQGQKLGPGYTKLKQDIGIEKKPAPKPATATPSSRNPYGL